MSSYYGDFLVGKTVRCRFNTVNSSGVPTSLSGIAAIVTKDGTDVTPSGGITPLADVGGVTGRNHVVIDMSVDTTTFTAGSEYSVRLSGSSNVGGTSYVGIVVGEWSVVNRAAGAGTVNANVVQFASVTTYAYDGVLASATSNTITFPATDVAGTAIPDDGRYENTRVMIVGGTGGGQSIKTTTKTSTPRQYNVLPSTMPTLCDGTSQYVVQGSALASLDLTQAVPMTNTAGTTGDSLLAARAQGFGKWTWPAGSTTVTLFGPDNNTTVKTLTVDSATIPRSRS